MKDGDSFKNVIYKTYLHIFYIFISIYKEDLVLNDLEWLIGHKTKSNQTRKIAENLFIRFPGAWTHTGANNAGV